MSGQGPTSAVELYVYFGTTGGHGATLVDGQTELWAWRWRDGDGEPPWMDLDRGEFD